MEDIKNVSDERFEDMLEDVTPEDVVKMAEQDIVDLIDKIEAAKEKVEEVKAALNDNDNEKAKMLLAGLEELLSQEI